MSPIEHYFENLLDMGSDIKGDPNKNALSREVQEAVEICADYVKYDLLLGDTKSNMVAMLEELQLEIKEQLHDNPKEYGQTMYNNGLFNSYVLIQQRINSLKEK